MKSRAAGIGIGAVFGAIPGAILVLLTVPVSGEAEFTLGVTGFFLCFVGLVAGAAIGVRRRETRTR